MVYRYRGLAEARPPPLASRKRGCASMIRTTYRHPASVRCADSAPSMATRRLRSRRPVSARALRCGLRSSFLVTAPSLRLVATTRLRTTPHRKLASCRSPPGDIVPPGLVMRRPSEPPCLRRVRSTPCSRLPAEDCDDILSSLVASLRCAQVCAVVQWGGIPPKVAMASCHRCSQRPNATIAPFVVAVALPCAATLD